MSYTTNPTGIFGTGVYATVSGIVIPYSALESYSVSTSGDVRELTYSFLEKMADVVTTLPTTGTNSRWNKLNVTRGVSVVNDEVLRKTYNVSIDLNIQSLDVVDES